MLGQRLPLNAFQAPVLSLHARTFQLIFRIKKNSLESSPGSSGTLEERGLFYTFVRIDSVINR
ncbi:hypothetical protein GEI7407_3676 [Geitlerinema sp. PCC 7407]|nr:hypothetical protein GEI7407_3676 [Geitlerinema sp. PCC 7407]